MQCQLELKNDYHTDQIIESSIRIKIYVFYPDHHHKSNLKINNKTLKNVQFNYIKQSCQIYKIIMRYFGGFLNRLKYFATLSFIGSYQRYQSSQQPTYEELQTTVSKIFFSIDQAEFSDLKLFAIGNQDLGKEIASHLDISLGRHQTSKFADGQISMQIHDSVSGHKVVILKTFDDQSISDGLMELILAVSAMKKNGATHVTSIIPYFPYTINPIDQNAYEQSYHEHHPYASDIARLIESSGCDTIITLNSQINQLKGFSNKQCNIISLDCTQLAVPYLIHRNLFNPILVGSRPNPAISKRLKQLAQAFNIFDINCGFGIFSSMIYVGDDVKDRDIILFTNVLRTGNRLAQMVKNLQEQGAKNIYALGIHATNKTPQFKKLVDSLPLNQLIVTNTYISSYDTNKIRTLSVAKYLAQVISILNKNTSLNLFRNQRDLLKYFFLQKIRKRKQSKQLSLISESQLQAGIASDI